MFPHLLQPGRIFHADGLGRMIANWTGLEGTYDFTLEWAPQGADASDPRPSEN